MRAHPARIFKTNDPVVPPPSTVTMGPHNGMMTEHALRPERAITRHANLAAVAIFPAASDVHGSYLLIFTGVRHLWVPRPWLAPPRRTTRDAAQIGTLARFRQLARAWRHDLVAATTSLSRPVAGGFHVYARVAVHHRDGGRAPARRPAVADLVTRANITWRAIRLLSGGGALALAIGLAVANIVAALPALVRLAPCLAEPSDRAGLRAFLDYGWPLVIAFGVTALGQNVDRLLLAHVVGIAELGSYGATSDFLKQSFGVIGEAIALAVVSIAKDAAIRGDETTARRTLEDAFRALAATVSLGAVFIVTFADELVQVVFGPDFRGTARALVPPLIIANGVLIFRAFYFGQSIYFGQSSRNAVIAAALMLSVTGGLAVLLIPGYGIFGAAWAATGGQIAACSVFILARPRMPVPFASLAGIVATAALVLLADVILDDVAALGTATRIAAKLAIFVLAGTFVIWRFNILGLRDFTGGLRAAARSQPAKTMRVLQIIHNAKAGGVQTLAEIIGAAGARGVTVETAVLFPGPARSTRSRAWRGSHGGS